MKGYRKDMCNKKKKRYQLSFVKEMLYLHAYIYKKHPSNTGMYYEKVRYIKKKIENVQLCFLS